MTGQLEIYRDGRLGVIALNRPEAINALSREMIDGIARTLEQWRDEAEVRAVVFEGRGSRGFCSGGDVRAARQAVVEGRADDADAYFAAEYAMNASIATYPKPLVAIASGLVMGGGIGIAGHCGFRFVTPDARYAMPEAGIGFFSDVGVNFVLGKAPLSRALLFELCGLPVEPADAIALGLADALVPAERLDELRLAIGTAASAGNVPVALVEAMQRFGVEPGESGFCLSADRLADRFAWDSAESIVAGVQLAAGEDPNLGIVAEALATRSPTSLAAIASAHLAARRMATIAEVLAADLALARLMARLPDFAEGVRAQLVDKDRHPRWQPAGFEGVPVDRIEAALASGGRLLSTS